MFRTYLRTPIPKASADVSLVLRYRPTQGSICWKPQNTSDSTIRVGNFKAGKGYYQLHLLLMGKVMSMFSLILPHPADHSILRETKLQTSSLMIPIGFCRFQGKTFQDSFSLRVFVSFFSGCQIPKVSILRLEATTRCSNSTRKVPGDPRLVQQIHCITPQEITHKSLS